jgi:murein DD-endopeptidase MepM/ murein hydrolase activator NlpD
MNELLSRSSCPKGVNPKPVLVLCAAIVTLLSVVAAVDASASTAPVSRASVVVRTPAIQSAHVSPESEKVRRFWVHDKHFYRSRWYAGKHRKMIAFGCTRAPYYPHSPDCPGRQGFHHGLDMAMKCGTRLFAGLRGTVVRPNSRGALGSAYGPYAFRLRNHRLDLDFVIGHVKRVYVEPGDHVAKGELIARASDQGAPDGCHLHFEARPKGESYDAAIKPNRYLHLRRAGRSGGADHSA